MLKFYSAKQNWSSIVTGNSKNQISWCKINLPHFRPRVPRVPRGLRVATVDHVGMLVASDAEHHVGLGPLCQRTKQVSLLCPARSPCSSAPFLALGRARASGQEQKSLNDLYILFFFCSVWIRLYGPLDNENN